MTAPDHSLTIRVRLASALVYAVVLGGVLVPPSSAWRTSSGLTDHPPRPVEGELRPSDRMTVRTMSNLLLLRRRDIMPAYPVDLDIRTGENPIVIFSDGTREPLPKWMRRKLDQHTQTSRLEPDHRGRAI